MVSKVTQDSDWGGGNFTQVELPTGEVYLIWEAGVDTGISLVEVYASLDDIENGVGPIKTMHYGEE